MEYKYLLMKDSENSEYKDICSLDLLRTNMQSNLLLIQFPSSYRERFDKVLLGAYVGKNVRQIYQLISWMTDMPSIWDDDFVYITPSNSILYSMPTLESIESDIINQDLI